MGVNILLFLHVAPHAETVCPLRRLPLGWSQKSGRCSLPASPEDVAAYLKDRSETVARPSTLRVVAAAIARNHKDAGFDVPVHDYVARSVLGELTRGGRVERAASARRRRAYRYRDDRSDAGR